MLNKTNSSLVQAIEWYGIARNTLRDFKAICELKIINKKK